MNVGLFTDNDFSKTNGVTTTLRAVLRHLPGDVAARVYTADDVGADEPDYLSLRAAADVFFFPSRTDTFGNVVLEAQACGLPVIVPDEGGPREAVRHGVTGLICGSQGPFTLAVALSWMLREHTRRAHMGAAARRHAEARSWPLALEPLFDAWREAHRDVAAPPAARAPSRRLRRMRLVYRH